MDDISKIAKELLKSGNEQARFWIGKSLTLMGEQVTKFWQADKTQNFFENMKKTFNYLGYVLEDNSLMHLVTGQFEISESTVNSYLVELPEENFHNLHVRIDSNLLWVIGEGEYGGTTVMVEIPLEFMGFEFSQETKKVYFRIKEFPRMATPQTIRGSLMRLAAVVTKTFVGQDKIYEKFINDFEGVTIKDKEITIDLTAMESLNTLLSKKVLKWTLAEVLLVEKVVFIPGKIKIFGGLDFEKIFSFTKN